MPKSPAATEAPKSEEKVRHLHHGVRLTQDISGGFGEHKKGTILHNLSSSGFNTLTQGGLGVKLESTTQTDNVVDVLNQ